MLSSLTEKMIWIVQFLPSSTTIMIVDLKWGLKLTNIIEVVDDSVILIFATFLFFVCIFGFSVYHVAMKKDDNSQYFLLNVFYQQFAAVFQCGSIIVFLKVQNQKCLTSNSNIFTGFTNPFWWKWRNNFCLHSLQNLGCNWILVHLQYWTFDCGIQLEEIWSRYLFIIHLNKIIDN